MRDQYAGDISDVIKFAFLRALAADDKRLGIAWYYSPGDDNRPDGKHLEWQDEPAWKLLDAKLHDGLVNLPERTVLALQNADIWPKGAIFHGEPMPSRAVRSEWASRKRDALDQADIVFLDPDNGIGAESQKHATMLEIRKLRKSARATVFITFPGRNLPHDDLVTRLHQQLADQADAGSVITLRTSVSVPRAGSTSYIPRQRWFTIVDPDDTLTSRATEFAQRLATVPRVSTRLHV